MIARSVSRQGCQHKEQKKTQPTYRNNSNRAATNSQMVGGRISQSRPRGKRTKRTEATRHKTETNGHVPTSGQSNDGERTRANECPIKMTENGHVRTSGQSNGGEKNPIAAQTKAKRRFKKKTNAATTKRPMSVRREEAGVKERSQRLPPKQRK